MKITMIGALFAVSSSTASAFGSRAAFRASAARSFSRSSELFANPKGESAQDEAVYPLLLTEFGATNGYRNVEGNEILRQAGMIFLEAYSEAQNR